MIFGSDVEEEGVLMFFLDRYVYINFFFCMNVN